MNITEQETMIIKLMGDEISGFRMLMLDVLKGTKKAGFDRLILSPEGDRTLRSLIDGLTQED